jgi:hypothetical protein
LQLGNNSDKWFFISAFEFLDDVPVVDEENFKLQGENYDF